MLVMMLIGLVSYRIILRTLGVTDYGVYGAVSGLVTGFMLVMNTVASAISRYITVALGKGDAQRLRTTFGTSLFVMAAFCLLLVLLAETAGLWYLHRRMMIPAERMPAADAVLHSSMLVLAVNLLSLPYMAAINAHEHMDAYAYISILEAVLKLAVALLVFFAPADKLQVYAWLLLASALLSRGAYVLYAVRRFRECRGRPRFDGALLREMGAFAGWNFVGSGAYMLNTQGVNQLMNLFFGVGMNAARGVADKVEQVVRQFATNVALALNPALTKAYAGGNRDYAFELVYKATKYYLWILWVLTLPFLTDGAAILRLWLGEVPPEAALFTALTLLCFVVDFTPSVLNVLEQAHGRIRRYYLLTSAVAAVAFPLTWLAYRHGLPAWSGYAVFLGCYLLKGGVMLRTARRDTGLPLGDFWRRGLRPALLPALSGFAAAELLALWLAPAWWRFFATAAAGALATGAAAWAFGLTPGEKSFVSEKWKQICGR